MKNNLNFTYSGGNTTISLSCNGDAAPTLTLTNPKTGCDQSWDIENPESFYEMWTEIRKKHKTEVDDISSFSLVFGAFSCLLIEEGNKWINDGLSLENES